MKQANEQTDPTFGNRGGIAAFLTSPNARVSSIVTSSATLTYGSTPLPPPPWNRGADWATPTPTVYDVKAGAVVQALAIRDRSTNMVVPNANYYFAQPFTISQQTLLSLYFVLSGVEGGSTIVPGFGLFNLGTNPNAWTYVTPTGPLVNFTFSIGLRADDFFSFATLTVQYVPYSYIVPGGYSVSRLVYTITGCAGDAFAPPSPPWWPSNAVDAGADAQQPRPIELVDASGEYSLTKGEPAPSAG